MLCLSGFELYSRWVPLMLGLHYKPNFRNHFGSDANFSTFLFSFDFFF